MDKESIYEFQKIDCNCNDCKFMIRNQDKKNKSLELHHKWQLDYFNVIKQKLIDKAVWWKKRKNDIEKWDLLMSDAESMKFVFDKSTAVISYGNCSKFNKPISFIPNICQIETQKCFKHRKDEISS
jgi:hypothetical protein